jgi:hypothetical protein
MKCVLTVFALTMSLLAPIPAWAVEVKLAVLVVTFPASPPHLPDIADQIRAQQLQVDAFYAEQSYQQLILTSDVFGVYTVPLDTTATRAQIKVAADQAATTAGVNLALYTAFVYLFPATDTQIFAISDATGSYIPSNAGYPTVPSFRVELHELGHHVLGYYLHANARICTDATPLGSAGGTCTSYSAGDSVDVMGLGLGHVNAIIKQSLGWLTLTGPQQILQVGTSGDYTILPYEVATPGIKALRVKGKQSVFTFVLEYRQPLGFDVNIPQSGVSASNVYSGVLFHLLLNNGELLRMTPGDGSPSFINAPSLPAGQTWCYADGRMEFTVVSATTAGAVVHVQMGQCK